MQKYLKLSFVAVVCAALSLSVARAQPSTEGRSGGMRGEGARRHPQMQLGRTMTGVGMLEKSGKNKLSAAQAKKIVSTIGPWRSKASMTSSQATNLNNKLLAVLTAAQKKELQELRPRRGDDRLGNGSGRGRSGQGRSGPGKGGAHREGRDGGPRGAQRRGTPPTEAERQQMRARFETMRQFLASYNPFYPPTKYSQFKEMPERMQESVKRRFAAQEALLSQLAKKATKA
jgi:hypothetical protein